MYPHRAVLLLAILPCSLFAALIILDAKMGQTVPLMRRVDPEYAQCDFTFPIYDYVEFEANPDIVSDPIFATLKGYLTRGCRQESV